MKLSEVFRAAAIHLATPGGFAPESDTPFIRLKHEPYKDGSRWIVGTMCGAIEYASYPAHPPSKTAAAAREYASKLLMRRHGTRLLDDWSARIGQSHSVAFLEDCARNCRVNERRKERVSK